MHGKKFPVLIFLIALVLFGHTAVCAKESPGQKAGQSHERSREQAAPDHNLIQGRSEATIEELGELDSRIEILKKQLEIKRLENEIKEEKQHGKPPQNIEQQLQQLDQLPFTVPSRTQKPPEQHAPDEPRAERERDGERQKQEMEQYVSRARVVSVSGFGDNVRAEIKLPEGGIVTVRKGQDFSHLGTIKSVSLDSVVMESSGDEFSVPFSEDFRDFSPATTEPMVGAPGHSGFDSSDFPAALFR